MPLERGPSSGQLQPVGTNQITFGNTPTGVAQLIACALVVAVGCTANEPGSDDAESGTDSGKTTLGATQGASDGVSTGSDDPDDGVDGSDGDSTDTGDSGEPGEDPNGPVQFLTWDGGSGPTRVYWSHKLNLPWANPDVGDWLDAEQVPQGPTAYVQAPVEEVGPVSIDVTGLVARWVETGENRGFYLRSDQAFSFHVVGRTNADEAARPQLEIVTDEGTFMAPPLANANWSGSTAQAFDTRENFEIGSGNSLAIVQFDLTDVVGTVRSATLGLSITELMYPGNINVLEANPPTFRIGGGGQTPLMGLAEAYPLDKGIDADRRVLFAGDFADLEPWSGGCSGVVDQVEDPETESTYLRGKFTAGQTGSCAYEYNVVVGAEDGTPAGVETALYARYYVYLEGDWGSTVDGNKMPGWDTRMGWWNPAQGGYWQSTTGNGGSAGTGLKVWNEGSNRWEYEGHSIRGLGGPSVGDGNPYDHYFWLKGYVYNLDQGGPYGSGVPWPATVLAKERWISIEQYVQLNSIEGPFDEVGNGTAVADGIYRVWVDGVLSAERTDLRWTRHPELGLQGFWLNWYHGGTQPPTVEMHYRMNNVVIAREYIGPRVDR